MTRRSSTSARILCGQNWYELIEYALSNDAPAYGRSGIAPRRRSMRPARIASAFRRDACRSITSEGSIPATDAPLAAARDVHAGSEADLEHAIARGDPELRQDPFAPLAVLDRHQHADDGAKP